ncbi:unnamed protein product [Rotaria sp. Silwood1]|nr:unnamed protein product [Rotaria sp. Silwood1]CAF1599651.1 unnamed protein product [Rotaria sp. Silwood1]CAF3631035.1 unnamed protein product [Rotaria sp. Silwood1]CAF3704992.1 unnamed protein product [Rotaria sp. Silwood1]CAF4630550.1 unnamed protein product [Rotaria sp. Silwood1]
MATGNYYRFTVKVNIVVSQTQDWIGVKSRKLPIALGDFNNDNQLDIIVTQRDDKKIHIFLGYAHGAFAVKPTTSVTSSSLPYSIAVGDFNNDNWLDFVVANYDHNNIGVFLGYGNGTFANENIYSTGSSRPLSLVIHDLNNDKQLDIVIANNGTNTIGVLLGAGNGTFANPMTFSTGFDSLPHAVVVGDFNSDIRPDIAVANSGSNTIGLLLGYGNGTFSHQITYPTHGHPISLAVGDLNDDTQLDIVVANDGSNIQVLLGNDNGTFTNQAIYTTGSGSYPSWVAVRDFNKDGRLDIIVTNTGTNNLGLFLGYGDGNFENQRLYPINNGAPQIVDTGDLNNDSWIDVVVAIDSPYNVAVFLGGPDKNFTNLTTYPTGGLSDPYSVVVGDFDNDTWLDVIVANYKSDEIAVFLGQGNGNFDARKTYSTGSGSMPESIAVGDFNSDHRLDIVVANTGTDNIGIFLGYDNGAFLNQTTYQTGTNSKPSSVAVGDFNNDNQLDFAVANSGTDSLGIFLGYGNGTFSNQIAYSTGVSSQPTSIAVGDFNNDTQLDIAVTNAGTNILGIFLGHGNGTFSNQIAYPTGSSSTPNSIAIGDFDSDTRLDIVVVNAGTNNLCIFFGKADGSFSNQTEYPTGNNPMQNSVTVGDLNNDTKLDLIVANFYDNNIGVFLGKGDGSFSTQTTYSTGWDSLPISVALGDFNSDNRLDIVVVLYYYFSIGIFLGYYNSPFTVPTMYSSGSISTPFALAVADFDNDNQLDLVATNYDDGNVAIYQNFVNGTFQSSKLYSTGYITGLYSIAVGDFNNDRQVDAVVVNYDSDNINFFLGFGNGSFGSVISYTTGLESGPCSVVVGDFNNDSRLDIVSANNRDNSIILFLHYDFGAFTNKEMYSTSSDKPSRSVAYDDFNKDTRLDMVVANYESFTITVLLGNGKGGFSNQTTYSTGFESYPFSVAVGDFNNDAQMDIAVANKWTFNIGIFLGKGDGTFFEQITYPTGSDSKPTTVAVGDFNNDTRLDIVVTNYGGYSIGVFLGNGDGTFSNQIEYATGYYSWPWGIAIGDFNNDARLDVVVSNQYGYNIGVFLGHGDGSFSNQTTYPTGAKSLPIGIAVGDFNNDNRMDIVVANYGSDNVGVFLGNGNGTFWNQVTYSTGYVSGPYWVIVGDFNKDAQLDVAVALSLSDTLAICFGNGNGTFSSPTTFGTGTSTYPWYLIAADFNYDNWLDVAIVFGNVGGVTVLLGDRNRMFLVPMKNSTGPNSAPQTIVVGDFNNDKHLDVAVTNSKSNNVGLFLGYGDGRFSKQVTYSTGANSQPWSLAVGDLNNDTQLDIVVTNRNSDNIGVFLGLGNGAFSNVMTYSTGLLSAPISIVILDFNKDNKLDIVVANNGANSISILQGYGDATFLSPTTYLTGYNSHPVWVVTGDFNKDDWMDIAVATLGTKNIKVLLKSC